MVTPIDAVRFYSTFDGAESCLRSEDRYRSSEYDTENLSPARGAMLGLILGGLMWVGLIAGFRAILGL
ncbi:MAG: hypothetical protein WBW84_05730 [Acidobacteriaceae bacterium]